MGSRAKIEASGLKIGPLEPELGVLGLRFGPMEPRSVAEGPGLKTLGP